MPQAGPQAANAALEVSLRLGFRNLLLLGCDFGTVNPTRERAKGAMGISPRLFDLPVAGGQGKTVYSNAELSTTRQLFEHALISYGATALAFGDGSRMKNVTHTKECLSDILSKMNPSGSYESDRILSELPVRQVCSAELLKIVQLAQVTNNELFVQLKSALQSEDALNQNITTIWNKVLSWSDSRAAFGEKLHRRLTRFLIFFVIQPLIYDNSVKLGKLEFSLSLIAWIKLSFFMANTIHCF